MVQLKQLVGVVAAVFLFAFVSVTHAQSDEAILLATTEIKDITLGEVVDNQVNLTFSLYNQEGAQPGVKYAVNLMEEGEGGLTLVDQHVYGEVLSIREGQQIDRTITYVAPAYLSGEYSIWLIAKNERDFPLSVVPVSGTVTLTGTEPYAALSTDDCYLTVDQDTDATKTYTPRQGVDILPTETLTAHCTVTNTFTKDTLVYPAMTVYGRSVFGPEVVPEAVAPRGITLKAGESTVLDLPLIIATEPQAYDTVLRLTDAEGHQALSSEAIFHYVVAGKSGTVQNTVFDKDYYAAGDTATLKVVLTGSADTFPGSRLAADTPLQNPTAKITIMGEGGACAAPVLQAINPEVILYDVPITITADCLNPTAAITMQDGTEVLDERTEGVQSAYRETAPVSDDTDDSYLFTIVTIAALLALIILLYLKRKPQDPTYSDTTDLPEDPTDGGDGVALKALFLALIFSGALLLPAATHAASFYVGGAFYTAQLDQTSYEMGETLEVSGTVQWASCANAGTERFWMVASTDTSAGQSDDMWSYPLSWSDTATAKQVFHTDTANSAMGNTTFTVPVVASKQVTQILIEGAYRPVDESTGVNRQRILLGYTNLGPNNPPNKPVITGEDPDNTHNGDEDQCVYITGTDPDGDSVSLALDGNNDGDTIDYPIDDNSGRGRDASFTKTYCTKPGVYGTTVTLRAKASDGRGGVTWSDPFTLTLCPAGEEDLGSGCQPVSVSGGGAACGPAHNTSYTFAAPLDPADLCTVGTAQNFTDDLVSGSLGNLNYRAAWNCVEGSDWESCSAVNTTDVTNGACGPANGGSYPEYSWSSSFLWPDPDTLCSAGFQDISGGTPPPDWTWTCMGVNGGTDDTTCRADYEAPPVVATPTCGDAINQLHTTTPTEDLCINGEVSYGPNFVTIPYAPERYVWRCENVVSGEETLSCVGNAAPRVLSVCIDGNLVAEGGGVEVFRGLNDGDTEDLTVFYDNTPNDCAGFNYAQLEYNSWFQTGYWLAFSTIGLEIVREIDPANPAVGLSNITPGSTSAGDETRVKRVTGYNTGALTLEETVDVYFQWRYRGGCCTYYNTSAPGETISLKYTVFPAGSPVAYGVCGDADSGSFQTAPTTDLCQYGTASAVQTVGSEYRWECGGTDYVNTSCTATVAPAGPDTLAVCADDELVASGDGDTAPMFLYQGQHDVLTAYYDGIVDCSGDNLINGIDATVTAADNPNNAVNLQGVYGQEVHANVTASELEEDVIVTYNGETITLNYTVDPDVGPDVLEVCDEHGNQIVTGGGSVTVYRNDGDTDNLSVYLDGTPDCAGNDITDTITPTEEGTNPSAITTTPGTTITVEATNPDPGDRTEDLTIDTATITYEVAETVIPSEPNLSANVGTVVASPGFDPTTGNHDYIELTNYNVFNNGTADAGASVLTIEVDLGNDGSIDITLPDINVPALSAGEDTGTMGPITLATNVPPGTNRVIVTVDADDDVAESDETDNEVLRFGPTGGYPDPGLELSVNPTLVRKGQTAELSWNTHAIYPMSCTVSGPGISTISFDPSVPAGTGNPTGSETTGPISSKSEFILQCTAPDGSVFSDNATVQSVGDIEEI